MSYTGRSDKMGRKTLETSEHLQQQRVIEAEGMGLARGTFPMLMRCLQFGRNFLYLNILQQSGRYRSLPVVADC